MRYDVRATGLALAATAVLVTGGAAHATPAGPVAEPANAGFKGHWTPNSGVGWTITRENFKTGVCAGTSDLKSSGYGLVQCRVSGQHYRFVITYGSYRSVNNGTLHGSHLTGRFNDGRGDNHYTATRRK